VFFSLHLLPFIVINENHQLQTGSRLWKTIPSPSRIMLSSIRCSVPSWKNSRNRRILSYVQEHNDFHERYQISRAKRTRSRCFWRKWFTTIVIARWFVFLLSRFFLVFYATAHSSIFSVTGKFIISEFHTILNTFPFGYLLFPLEKF